MNESHFLLPKKRKKTEEDKNLVLKGTELACGTGATGVPHRSHLGNTPLAVTLASSQPEVRLASLLNYQVQSNMLCVWNVRNK